MTPARILFVDDEQRILDGLRDLLRSLVNLIKNAADALGEAGRRELRLGVAADLAVHRAVCTIADSGSGIAADALAKIFAPFYTTKPDGQGHGPRPSGREANRRGLRRDDRGREPGGRGDDLHGHPGARRRRELG